MNGDAAVAPPQSIELVQDAGAAADRRPDRRARHAQPRERPDAEHQQRTQDDVDQVRDREHAHRDGRIAGTAEDGVDEEDQQDDDVAAEHDAGVVLAHRDDVRRSAHHPQQPGREEHNAERDALHRRLRRARRVLFSNTACDHRSDADRQAHRRRVDERQHRLGEPDGRDGAGTEVPRPEHVRDGKE